MLHIKLNYNITKRENPPSYLCVNITRLIYLDANIRSIFTLKTYHTYKSLYTSFICKYDIEIFIKSTIALTSIFKSTLNFYYYPFQSERNK